MQVVQNKNKAIVNHIKAQLSSNGGYCPCSLIHNKDTKCMCKEFREQIKRGEAGECHCGLYVLVEEVLN